MRPLLVRAVSIDGILENMGHMRSLAAEAHRGIRRRCNETLPGRRGRRALAGAVQRVRAVRKGAPGHRRQAGAGT